MMPDIPRFNAKLTEEERSTVYDAAVQTQTKHVLDQHKADGDRPEQGVNLEFVVAGLAAAAVQLSWALDRIEALEKAKGRSR